MPEKSLTKVVTANKSEKGSMKFKIIVGDYKSLITDEIKMYQTNNSFPGLLSSLPIMQNDYIILLYI